MEKQLITLIFIFISSTINADILRNSVSNLKQLNWPEIIDSHSKTYQHGLTIFNTVNIDSSNYYVAFDEKYGELSENNIGQYKGRMPAYGKYPERLFDSDSWTIDKINNQICYGNKKIEITKYTCAYMFEGLKNGKKSLYSSLTLNGDFYARTNHVLRIENESIFDQWSDESMYFSSENSLLTKKNQAEEEEITKLNIDFTLSDFCYLEPRVQIRNGIYYFPNEESGISETSICIFKGGFSQYQSKGQLLNGKFEGNWNWWNKNGQKLVKTNFSNGNPEGEQMYWHVNGKIRYLVNRQDGFLEGKSTKFYSNGKQNTIKHYLDGNLDGIYVIWNANGKKIKESNWKDGKCISGDCD